MNLMQERTREELKMMKEKEMNGLSTAKSLTNSSSLFSGFQFSQGTEKKGRFTMNVKKILAALAVTGCALHGYSDITASNIVGYNEIALNEGSTLMTADFLGVGESEKVMLSTLKIGGYTGNSKDICYIQELNSDGSVAATYNWRDKSTGVGTKYTPGWYYEEGTKPIGGGDVADVELASGKGLWVVANEPNYTMTLNGQVRTAEKVIELAEGSTPTGNIFPTTIKLSSLTVGGYTGNSKDICYIQKLYADGSVAATYNWRDKSTGVGTKYTPGWYYEEGTKPIGGGDVADVEITPTEGLWVVANEAGYTLKFAAINLDK